ncbi:RDD family protein [Prosthecobacter sp.]|uniref:RDD family protein n=1 Tax=Prosthecobacter sp. TaxID=1965333 RepID=UPI002AB82487|nr:RDD family protein [Prosthecobacter sp.]MDZ4404105.1 RDD family protein [Prosthecobacter sp.]
MKYHLARGEDQLGTFNDLDVSAGLRDGRFLPTDLCWAEGMKEWQALGAHMKEVAVETGMDVVEPEPPAISALREEVRQDHARDHELASLGQRLAAKLIDWAMLLAPLFVMLMALMDAGFEAEIRALQNDPTAMMDALQRQIDKMQTMGNTTVLAMSWLVVILVLANVILLSIRGQSIGKLLTGIQIVRSGDGSKAGFIKTVLLRWFLFAIVESIRFIGPVLMFGNILLIFRKDRRCMHDLVADTMVTKKNG